MTPERRMYLASISKEERVIRNQIDYHRSSLKLRKWLINGKVGEDDISLWKSEIAGEKIVIKNLKKQLPAPLLERPICLGSEMYYFCSACGIVLISDTDNYCYKCGQKLR